jgi:hypothetical protein
VSQGDSQAATGAADPAPSGSDDAVSEGPVPGGIERSVARRQAAKAALLVALILAISSQLLWGLLLIPLAGMLAVQLYLRRRPEPKLSPGAGAGIGLLTGFLGFLIFGIPALPFTLWVTVFHPDPAVLKELHAQMDTQIQRSPNPQAQQIAQSLMTPHGLLLLFILGFAILLILTLVLSAVGGAMGAGIGRRRP